MYDVSEINRQIVTLRKACDYGKNRVLTQQAIDNLNYRIADCENELSQTLNPNIIPTLASLAFCRAGFQIALGLHNEAIEYLSARIRSPYGFFNNYAEAHILYAEALIDQRNSEKGIIYLEPLLDCGQLLSRRARAHKVFVKALAQQGLHERADEHIETIHSFGVFSKQEVIEAHVACGQTLLASGHVSETKSYLRPKVQGKGILIAVAPAQVTYASSLILDGQPQMAQRQLRGAIHQQLDPSYSTSELYFLLCLVHQSLGKLEKLTEDVFAYLNSGSGPSSRKNPNAIAILDLVLSEDGSTRSKALTQLKHHLGGKQFGRALDHSVGCAEILLGSDVGQLYSSLRESAMNPRRHFAVEKKRLNSRSSITPANHRPSPQGSQERRKLILASPEPTD